MGKVKKFEAPAEGRRERKRRETRARIAETAMALFAERGFTAVTIDDISEAADISKPTFFNYFPAKEDVVLGWQDKFAMQVAEALVLRPDYEPLSHAIEQAMIETLAVTATPESFAMTDLIRETPALAARNQAKYVNLENTLAEAMKERVPDIDPVEVRLLAMMAVGALRIGTEEWFASSAAEKASITDFSRHVFSRLWAAVGRLDRDLKHGLLNSE